ncbi:MAG: hypothetical protein ACYCT0_01615 [Sulfobacillus sp.]
MALYACGYVLHFDDGGQTEQEILFVGELAQCEILEGQSPEPRYRGPRVMTMARFVIRPVSDPNNIALI